MTSWNSPSWEAMCDDQKNGCETNQQTLVKLRWFLFLYILSQQIKAVRSCWKQQHPHSESVKSHKISEKHLSEYKKVKAHTSQRLKRLELFRVSLTWRMPRGIATPPPPGRMLIHRRVASQQYVAGTHLKTRVRDTERNKVLREQRDGPGFEIWSSSC